MRFVFLPSPCPAHALTSSPLPQLLDVRLCARGSLSEYMTDNRYTSSQVHPLAHRSARARGPLRPEAAQPGRHDPRGLYRCGSRLLTLLVVSGRTG